MQAETAKLFGSKILKAGFPKDSDRGTRRRPRTPNTTPAQHRHGPRVERELRDVEYRFTLDYHTSVRKGSKDISAARRASKAARALAREDPELIEYTRGNLEAPGFPFIEEEPLLSLAEQVTWRTWRIIEDFNLDCKRKYCTN